ncbi:MAG TPA: response regulator [Rhodocyclaceae bacterium]
MSEAEMEGKPQILGVEDDATMHERFAAALEGNYRLIAATRGEEALALAAQAQPDAILLDVEMPPGMDGYETCRRLKDDPATAAIPVIFISARDGIEDRIRGYEAGGEDYLVKPFDEQELEAKLLRLLKAAEQRASLEQRASYASSAAMTAMTSMSEQGNLLQSIKGFSSCSSVPELAATALAGLAPYGLRGAVQVRAPGGTLTLNGEGVANPLEASVISHMGKMERIMQFSSRLCITYKHVSLLVHDLPTEDPDRCGRLRDHLAVLAEAAEARAEALIASAESHRRGATIEHAVSRITATLEAIDRAQRENQVAVRLVVEAFTQRMESAYVSVALSPSQEDFMNAILQQGLDQLLNTQTGVFDMQNQLSSIVQELKRMAAPAAT